MPVFTNWSFLIVEVVSHLISQQFEVCGFIGFAAVIIKSATVLGEPEKFSSEKAFT